MTVRLFLFIAGLGGCAGVALGALAAHALGDRLPPAALANVETASRYLLVHSALLVALAAALHAAPQGTALRVSGYLVASGMILFCGGLSIAGISGVRTFAAVAPAGGMALMAGWLVLAIYALWRF